MFADCFHIAVLVTAGTLLIGGGCEGGAEEETKGATELEVESYTVSGRAENLEEKAPIGMLVTVSGEYCVPDDTDAAGAFFVEGVERGDKRLISYGETASNGLFASVALPISVTQDLELDFTVLSPALSERYPVDTSGQEPIKVESLDGLLLEFQADSLTIAPFMPAEIQVARIPLEKTPAFVPEGVSLDGLFVLHPIRSTFDTAATLAFPPLDNVEAGTSLVFYTLDYDTGWLKEVASGTIDTDGRPRTNPGEGIFELTWVGIALEKKK